MCVSGVCVRCVFRCIWCLGVCFWGGCQVCVGCMCDRCVGASGVWGVCQVWMCRVCVCVKCVFGRVWCLKCVSGGVRCVCRV